MDDAKVLEAVRVLMGALDPGEVRVFRMQVTRVVVKPGERVPVALLVVTLPAVLAETHGAMFPLERFAAASGRSEEDDYEMPPKPD